MNPVNLYFITRPKNWRNMALMEQALSKRDEKLSMKEHEWQSLKTLVECLEVHDDVSLFDFFYVGYRIPHIGKEFDLLRISSDHVLNIELKSVAADEKKLYSQLVKNRYYLENLARDMDLFTFVAQTRTIYRLEGETMKRASIYDVLFALQRSVHPEKRKLDQLFSPANFLISPITTPDRFLNQEYFLTSHQRSIKKEIFDALDEMGHAQIFAIKGRPGTGKSLLLYDLALTLSTERAVILFHCAKLPEGLIRLDEALPQTQFHLRILSMDQMGEILKKETFSAIFIDEAHHLALETYNEICAYSRKTAANLFFSYDPNQVLTGKEWQDDISGRLESNPDVCRFTLTNNIRFNTEIAAFIKNLMNLTAKHHYNIHAFPHVDLLYGRSREEIEEILRYYRSKGYVYIALPGEKGDYTPEEVVGQEFEQVIMVMDETFYYDEEHLRSSRTRSDSYLYTRMLYQGLTRTRGRLAVAVRKNRKLLEKLLEIVN